LLLSPGRLRQEVLEFKANMGYIARLCFKQIKKKNELVEHLLLLCCYAHHYKYFHPSQ
jgi:hypothetical protein